MLRTGLRLAVSSIVGLLALTVGLLLLTGLLAVPTARGTLALGVGFVVLSIVAMVLAFPSENGDDERDGGRIAD